MAFWQLRSLIRQETPSPDAATRRLTLPRSNYLSALKITLDWDNDTTRNTESILDAIDRIEVIANGSSVLFSMRGFELFRHNWFAFRRHPFCLISEDPADTQIVELYVLFGRHLYDDQFALNLADYNDVELRVQYSPTIAAGNFVTAAGELNVEALMYMEGPLPGGHAGFLRNTEVFSFTSAASGDERIELPRRFPWRNIVVVAREAAIEDGVDITELELDINSGARIQLNQLWLRWQEFNARQLDIEAILDQILFVADTNTAVVQMSRLQNVGLSQTVASDPAADTISDAMVTTIAGDTLTIDAWIEDHTPAGEDLATDATARRYRCRVQGVTVPHSVILPFDIMEQPGMAFDPRPFDIVELVLTNGGAGADTRVILQEIIPPGALV